MELSKEGLQCLCGIGVSTGAFALGLVGVNVIPGATELLTHSGSFALSVDAGHEKTLSKIEQRVSTKITKNYKKWIESGLQENPAKAQEVEAVLSQLPDALQEAKPTVQQMIDCGLDANRFCLDLISALPKSSLFKAQGHARSLFISVISGVHNAVCIDSDLKPLFDSLNFKKIQEKLDEQTALMKKFHKEQMKAINTKTGVSMKALRDIFETLELQFDEDEIETKALEAIARIKELASRPVDVGNLGADVKLLIENARRMLGEDADVEAAVASFQVQYDDADVHMLRSARLAEEEARMYAAVFRFDEAITAFKKAARYNPDDPWHWYDIGDIRFERGNLEGALTQYNRGQAIALKTGNQRDLSVSYDRIGNVEISRGNLEVALSAYQQGLAIAEALAGQDKTNTQWQRDLSVSYNKIGDVERSRGNLEAALSAYQQGLAIAKALAEQDKTNTGWQRDLAISHERIGEVEFARGKLDETFAAFEQRLNITTALVELDKTNSDWQREHSVSYNKIGDVERSRGNLEAALSAYQQDLAIAEALARQDKTNTQWQRDLSVSYEKIGDVEVSRGSLDAALTAYQQGLAIREKLAEQDKTNTQWQRDVIVSNFKLAETGDKRERRYKAALEIAERLEKEGRLAPVDAYIPGLLRERLAAAKGE